MKSELIFLSHTELRLHPENIRLYYPDSDVAEMADSIRAAGGVYQALLITPISGEVGYYVIDGNLRLAGARTLGDDCPPLKCEVVEADRAEQLLIMAATSERVYPKDPASKGRHYRRLMEQEGLSAPEIAARIGCHESTIYNYLTYTEVDEPVQQLVMQGKITGSASVMRLIMKIPDAERRISLAERFARNGTSARGMAASIRHVLRQLREVEGAEIRETRPRGFPAGAKKPTLAAGGNGHLDTTKLLAAAENTLCEECRLDGLGKKCWVCPGPYEFMQHIVEMAEFRQKKETEA